MNYADTQFAMLAMIGVQTFAERDALKAGDSAGAERHGDAKRKLMDAVEVMEEMSREANEEDSEPVDFGDLFAVASEH